MQNVWPLRLTPLVKTTFIAALKRCAIHNQQQHQLLLQPITPQAFFLRRFRGCEPELSATFSNRKRADILNSASALEWNFS